MPGTAWNPRTRRSSKQTVLVLLETDVGPCGVGEGWASGGSPRALIATIADIALWDLVGKAAGMPLYRLLGSLAPTPDQLA